ncbi:hypothetical protein BESB_001920 [Besnoitia besnoiti]|uniref:Uncharacterized protein n=1 Tax=Besnoitia besnoiti TaxID=94643 RepID=A0A2A9MPQ5_BESBE|nr:hypothetical protein BESB_001920 [Besnoitia besnoiti]PFH37850.1 hypothetical protein BESB_001920 [Besnoitia besnoiti]
MARFSTSPACGEGEDAFSHSLSSARSNDGKVGSLSGGGGFAAQAKRLKKLTAALVQGRLSSAPASSEDRPSERREASLPDLERKKKSAKYPGDGIRKSSHSQEREAEAAFSGFFCAREGTKSGDCRSSRPEKAALAPFLTDRLVGEDALKLNSFEFSGLAKGNSENCAFGWSGGSSKAIELPSNVDEAGPQLVDRNSLGAAASSDCERMHAPREGCPRVLPFQEIFRMFNPYIPQPIGSPAPAEPLVEESEQRGAEEEREESSLDKREDAESEEETGRDDDWQTVPDAAQSEAGDQDAAADSATRVEEARKSEVEEDPQREKAADEATASASAAEDLCESEAEKKEQQGGEALVGSLQELLPEGGDEPTKPEWANDIKSAAEADSGAPPSRDSAKRKEEEKPLDRENEESEREGENEQPREPDPRNSRFALLAGELGSVASVEGAESLAGVREAREREGDVLKASSPLALLESDDGEGTLSLGSRSPPSRAQEKTDAERLKWDDAEERRQRDCGVELELKGAQSEDEEQIYRDADALSALAADSKGEGAGRGSEQARRGLVIGRAEFPEWLMQIDGEEDSDDGGKHNPYRHVRLRKVGVRELLRDRQRPNSCESLLSSAGDESRSAVSCLSPSLLLERSRECPSASFSLDDACETDGGRGDVSRRERSEDDGFEAGGAGESDESAARLSSCRSEAAPPGGAGRSGGAAARGGREREAEGEGARRLTAAEKFRLEQERLLAERQRRIELDELLRLFEERKKLKQVEEEREEAPDAKDDAPEEDSADESRQLSVSALRARFEKSQNAWFTEQLGKYRKSDGAV